LLAAFAKFALAPLETIRVIQQAQGLPSKNPQERWGYFETFKIVFKRHGIAAFWYKLTAEEI